MKRVCLLTIMLTLVMSFTAFAGDWYQKDGEWYYTDTSNPWVRYGDDWYYIDTNTGKMMTNYITPDGYYISFSGRMVNQGNDVNQEKNSVESRKINFVLKYIETGDSSVLKHGNIVVSGSCYGDGEVGLFNGNIYKGKLEKEEVWGYNQKEVYDYVNSILYPIAKESVSLPPVERAQFLYDKVCDLLVYDGVTAEQCRAAEAEGHDLWGAWSRRNVAGTLLAGCGFCEEYTSVYNRLCNLAGLDAFRDGCTSCNHVWTVLDINGERYYADTSAHDQIGVTDRRVVKNCYWCTHNEY